MRTPGSPRDLRSFRLNVRGKAAWLVFLFAEFLSSINSVDASVAPLFADVVGTPNSSDFLLAFMSAVPSVTFSDRSAVKEASSFFCSGDRDQ